MDPRPHRGYLASRCARPPRSGGRRHEGQESRHNADPFVTHWADPSRVIVRHAHGRGLGHVPAGAGSGDPSANRDLNARTPIQSCDWMGVVCAREDLNLHDPRVTRPSTLRVYQFRHWRVASVENTDFAPWSVEKCGWSCPKGLATFQMEHTFAPVHTLTEGT